uniref:Actin- protein 5 n=1 Tax=Sphaerodactylus townsendi TaxID=933632 RepID=A0ACB8F692_9SAUR
MTAAVAAGGVFQFRDARWEPDPQLETSPAVRVPQPAPLVLDNGSFQMRLGWACADAEVPGEPLLRFRSIVARSRGARGGAGVETQVGNDVGSAEPLRWLLRSPFDRNVPVQMELQELLLDHGFQRLGVSSQAKDVEERGMNKNEGTGRLDAKNCKRINLGGCQAAMYLQRLLQLKYPGHLAAITLGRVEEILHEHSYIAEDYREEMVKWRSPEYYEENVHKMQLPFSNKLLGSTLTSEEKQERRQQQLRRLQELNSRRREEKLQLDQERLDRLLYVQELLEDGQMEQFHKALVELNMDSAEELQSYIHKLSMAVEQTKQKILQAEVSVEVDVVDSKPETPDLDLLGSEQSMDDVESMNEFEPLFAEEQPEAEKPITTVQPVFNLAEYHQLFIGTERIRVPEIIFQPSLIGEEQAGIAETMQFVLDRYSKEQQQKLVQNVFLTGGNMMYPGMKARIQKELLEMRPFQSSFQVHFASNPVLDAWYGARNWALEYVNREEGWITRKDYEEKGGEYLKEHCASNVYVPIRLPKQTPRTAEASASSKALGPAPNGASEQT